MKKASLVQRVLAFVNGGDEQKLVRFETKLGKYFNKQISMRKETIENLEDKINDAQEALDETVVNVNVGAINDADGAENYCEKYVQAVMTKMAIIDEYKEEIKDLNAEIEQLEAAKTAIYSVDEKSAK
jgi:hypothetical protein